MYFPQVTIYKSYWKDETKAIFYHPNVTLYEGDWEGDKKNGKGKFNYSDGSIYYGDWKKDKKMEKVSWIFQFAQHIQVNGKMIK